MCILWFMATRYKAKIPCTAPTAHQLFDILWSELSKWHGQMDPAFGNQFEYTSEKFYHKQHKEQWFCVPRTSRKDSPEALQGFHGENLLFILEEAAGIPDEVYTVAEGSLTSKDNYVILVGNPTRLSGFFYRAFHQEKKHWCNLHFSSEDSELVDPAYCERMAEKYGKNSNIYRVRVKGDFPSSEEDQLISIDVFEAAAMRDLRPTGPTVWGGDVARYGQDKSALCKRQGGVILGFEQKQGLDTMSTATWFELEAKKDLLCIDEIGIGAGVVDALLKNGANVTGINVGSGAEDAVRYFNKRAELYWQLRECFENGDISLSQLDQDTLDELKSQLTQIKYKFSTGRLQIESKEDMKRRGLPSPDLADALMLSFAMGFDAGESVGIYSVPSEMAYGPRLGHGTNPFEEIM